MFYAIIREVRNLSLSLHMLLLPEWEEFETWLRLATLVVAD